MLNVKLYLKNFKTATFIANFFYLINQKYQFFLLIFS